ncbi:hypothetical protein [Paraclostridium dentum]|uniref:hypothetical protein n=1 Tax=Paraclostridium dentum TaxID=2662455 RepID=UPI003F2F0B56
MKDVMHNTINTIEDNVINLDNSVNGIVEIDSIEGNTLVNYCIDGDKELTLNGDIDTEGIDVAITEGVDNGLIDIMCEGKTMVNCIKENTFKDISNFPIAQYNPVLENNSVTLKSVGASDQTRLSPDISRGIIKPNTKYTFVFDVLENTLTNTMYLLYTDNNTIDVSPFSTQKSIIGKKTGRFKYIVTSKSDLSACNRLFRSMI